MTRLEERLGRKLDKRDIGKQFFVSNGHDVFVKSINTNLGLVTCCYGFDRTRNIVRNLDGSHYDGDTGKPCPQPLQIVRPAINIGDTVRLMPADGSYYFSESHRNDSLVAEVISFATASSGQCGRFITALEENLEDNSKERYVILEHNAGLVWEERYVQLVRRKDESPVLIDTTRPATGKGRHREQLGRKGNAMTKLEQRLGRKLDKRDINRGFFTEDGVPVTLLRVDDYGRCLGRPGKNGDLLVWGPDGYSEHHPKLVRPAINIGDTVRLMPPNGSYYKTEQDREDSFVAEVVSFATAASGQCGRSIAALQEHLGDTPKELYVILEHSSGPIVWEERYVQLVRRKDEAVEFGRGSSAVAQQNTCIGTSRFSCKEPNPSNTPKFGSSRIGVGDFVVSFNTRDEYSEREKITMAPLSLGRVAAVSMDGFTMGVELFAVNGNKIDGPSRPHAPYCTAMLRQAGVDEIEKYGGNSESTPPFVVGDYVVHEKIFEKTFSVTPVCKIKRLDGSGSALLQTVRPHSTDNEPYGAMVFLSDLRRPTIDEWHRDCTNELDVGDVVDLVPLLPIEGLQKGTRFVIERLDTQYWAYLKREVFTAYYKDRNGLTYNWPAFALRIVAKKPSKEQLEKLKPTIHSALPDTYEFIDEKRPLKIKPEDKFEAKMKLDADAYIEEELEHLDKPYNPDCMICHGDGFTEELGGKWPCKDCRPEAHKFVGKTKPEPKPKPYHRINEAGEVEVCMMYHGQAAIEAAHLDFHAVSAVTEKKILEKFYHDIEGMMITGLVTKAQVFMYAEQIELKVKAEREKARAALRNKWKGAENEGKAAGKTLPDPDGQA